MTGQLRLVDMPMLPWDGQTVNHVFLYLLMWTTCNLISLHMSALLLYLLPQMLFRGQTFVNVYRFVTFVRYMQDFCLSVVGVLYVHCYLLFENWFFFSEEFKLDSIGLKNRLCSKKWTRLCNFLRL